MRPVTLILLLFGLSCAHHRNARSPCTAYCASMGRVCAGFDYEGTRDYNYRCKKKKKKKKNKDD